MRIVTNPNITVYIMMEKTQNELDYIPKYIERKIKKDSAVDSKTSKMKILGVKESWAWL